MTLRETLSTNIPQELQARDQWVGWRHDKQAGSKPKKKPLNPLKRVADMRRGVGADPTSPSTWADFDTAAKAADGYRWGGVGFVFSISDPYVGIDLDHVRDPDTGELHPLALILVEQFASYAEISPSGEGLHIIIRGKFRGGIRGKYQDIDVEVYGDSHYLTMTGDRLPETPDTISDGQLVLDALLEGLGRQKPASVARPQPILPPAPNQEPQRLTPDDWELIARAMSAMNGETFSLLWDGDTSKYQGDDSAADLALVNLIGYWGGWEDLDQIDRIFRHSGLMRPKWDESRGDSTYGARTIEKAFATRQDFTAQTDAPTVSAGGQATREQEHRSPTGDNPNVWQPMANSGAVSDTPQFVVLSDVEPEMVTWLWPDRIPLGKVTLLEGDPDQGKSLISLDVAARLTTGALMPDGVKSGVHGPVGVVLVAPEDGLGDTIRPRFDAAGGEAKRLAAFTNDGAPLSLKNLDPLRDAIRHVGAKLVILDPIMSLVGGNVDVRQDHKVRAALAPLVAVAAEMDVAILAIRHHNKNEEQKAMHRGGGSIAFSAMARSGMLVARDPSDPSGETHVLAMFKHNLATEAEALTYRIETAANESPYIVWEGTTGYRADDLVRTGHEIVRQVAPSTQAEQWLDEYLACGCKSSSEVQEAAKLVPIADRTLQRAKTKLRVRSQRRGFGADGYFDWCHPDIAA